MPRPTSSPPSLQPDAKELILSTDPRYACETYIFEPSAQEQPLGYMFAAAETEDRGGVGKELLDLVISAVQKEYYRDPKRSPASSFELALHQANLILHDSAEQDIRDWMGHFHVAIAVLAGNTLHISVAGGANVQLCRKSVVTEVSTGLAHYPITNPLRTFSQLASGQVAARDTLFLSTLHFSALYRPEDLAHFAIEHSAATITSRLQQLYTDQAYNVPVAVVTVSLLPKYIVAPKEEFSLPPQRVRDHANTQQQQLAPRKPLVIHRTWLASIIYFLRQMLGNGWQAFHSSLWPHIKRGSVRGGQALYHASRATGRNVKNLTARQLSRLRNTQTDSVVRQLPTKLSMPEVRTIPRFLWSKTFGAIGKLPTTSKIFAVIALLLLVALGVSVVLLHKKRVSDQEIQHASELLHEAITKKDAAQSALVYNNRDQATQLLNDADGLLHQLSGTALYQSEAAAVSAQIVVERDRMQKITRATPDQVQTIGDFATALGKKTPTSLFYANNQLFTFNPDNNSIISMDSTGKTAVASGDNQGIGFFTQGTALIADKTLILATSDGGIALFDAKNNTVQKQDITLASKDAPIASLAAFGNRLYIFDSQAKNIVSYAKTLRGYSGASPWITDNAFPKDTITSLTVDGNIYTLHSDGVIRKLFKGASADFKQEPVAPDLSHARKIVTSDTFQYVYVLDPSENRIVIYSKKGALIRQVFFDKAQQISDFALDDMESTLYVLQGTKVIATPISAEPTASPKP
jgi:hypothetical protein